LFCLSTNQYKVIVETPKETKHPPLLANRNSSCLFTYVVLCLFSFSISINLLRNCFQFFIKITYSKFCFLGSFSKSPIQSLNPLISLFKHFLTETHHSDPLKKEKHNLFNWKHVPHHFWWMALTLNYII
jgi:hypothetical protein